MATAYIKEMINDTTSDIVYPVTKSQAVYMEDNSTTVQKAIDDLSALKNVPALDSQTSPNVSDLLTIFRNTNSTGYKALVSDVAKTIIESYQSSSLAGKTQSVKAALDSLNSRTLLPVFAFNSGSIPTLVKQSLTKEKSVGLFAFLPGVTDIPAPLTSTWAYMIIWRSDAISQTAFLGIAVNNDEVTKIRIEITS